MKSFIQKLIGRLGYELHRTCYLQGFEPGSNTRPIGRLPSFLQDIRARGFFPRGIIDVGAHCGEWSKLAHSIFPEAAFILVEPQVEMEAALRFFTGSIPDGQLVVAGAGREAGELVQTVGQDSSGSTFLPANANDATSGQQQRKTPIMTLDSVLLERPDFFPDLVKLDVQGFELEALRGGASLFGKTEMFILETSLFSFLPGQPTIREVIEFMAERGYEIYDVTEFARRPCDGALGQIDLAFVKASGRFRQTNAW